MKQIKDIMTKNVITINTETSLKTIISLMKENKIKKLPVLDSEKVIGIVQIEDLLIRKEEAPMPPVLAINDLIITLPNNKLFQSKLHKLTAYKAGEIMSKEFLMVNINDDLERVITNMLDNGYRYTLIEENNILKGILTQTDLLKNIF